MKIKHELRKRLGGKSYLLGLENFQISERILIEIIVKESQLFQFTQKKKTFDDP